MDLTQAVQYPHLKQIAGKWISIQKLVEVNQRWLTTAAEILYLVLRNALRCAVRKVQGGTTWIGIDKPTKEDEMKYVRTTWKW